MFSEMTRMRPTCARRPEAAMAIVLMKSICYLRAARDPLLVAERRLQEAEAARVELAGGLVVHLVRRDLHHLVLEVHRVARRTHLVLIGIVGEIARAGEPGEMARIGAGELHRRHRAG